MHPRPLPVYRRPCFILFALLGLTSLGSNAETTGEMYLACRSWENPMGTAEPDRMYVVPENRAKASKCDGAFAVLEGLGKAGVIRFCPPASLSRSQLVLGFTRWVRTNPGGESQPFTESVMRYLEGRFPCDSTSSTHSPMRSESLSELLNTNAR